MDKKAVGERLSAFRKEKKLGQKELMEVLGVKQGAISHYENGIRGLDPDDIIALKKSYPELNTDWLITGEGEMLVKQEGNTLREDQEEYKKGYTKVNTMTLHSNSDKNLMAVMTMESLSRIKTKEDLEKFFGQEKLPDGFALIPEIENCQAYLEMNCDEMHPTIKIGEKMACMHTSEIDEIIPGRYYLINFGGQVIVRRVYLTDEPNTLKLIVDNQFYPSFTIKKSQVRYLFTIHGQMEIKRMISPKLAA